MSDFVCYTSLQVLGSVSGKKDHRLASEKSTKVGPCKQHT